MFFPIEEWLPAFVLTVLVEGPIVVAGLRGGNVSVAHLALLLVFANLATHQAVWFVFTQLFLVGTTAYTVAAETWAAAAEAVFYWAISPGVSTRRVIAVAVAANAVSFVLGHVVAELWPDLLRLPT